MKIKGWSLNRTPKRKKEAYDKRIGFINNGDDNLYPDNMENFINNSITAKQCSTLFSDFLIGGGFEDKSLNELKVGYNESTNKDVTAYDLLTKIAYSFSRHAGVFISVKRDANLKIKGLNYITSRNARFGKQDSVDFKGKIGVYDKWGENKIEKKDISVYNIYDNKEKNIKYQITKKSDPSAIELAFELKKWKGQIFFQFLNDEYIYPLSLIDVVQHDADTEFQISLFKNGELRRGFFAKQIIAYQAFENEQDKHEFKKDLRTFEGANEGGSSMLIEGMGTNEKGEPILPFAIKSIDQNINDGLFTAYERSTSNNIRKSFKNPPPILIDVIEGKLGNSSGESIREAVNFYNFQTQKERDIITGIFTELMKYWHKEEYQNKDWTIKKFDYGLIDNI